MSATTSTIDNKSKTKQKNRQNYVDYQVYRRTLLVRYTQRPSHSKHFRLWCTEMPLILNVMRFGFNAIHHRQLVHVPHDAAV